MAFGTPRTGKIYSTNKHHLTSFAGKTAWLEYYLTRESAQRRLYCIGLEALYLFTGRKFIYYATCRKRKERLDWGSNLGPLILQGALSLRYPDGSWRNRQHRCRQCRVSGMVLGCALFIDTDTKNCPPQKPTFILQATITQPIYWTMVHPVLYSTSRR